MKRVGIIGMGVISKHYLEGLKNSTLLQLVAVCDTKKDFITKDLFVDYPHYENYLDMIKKESLDYVIISTPPKSHFDIAKECLEKNVNVIIEKPVVLQMEKLSALIELSKEKGLDFQVMYHWQNGSEVERFLADYDISKITQINVTVLDPYCDDGESINASRQILEGAWIDSGVNSLSFVKTILPFNNVEILDVEVEKCKQTLLPIKCDVHLLIDGVKVNILVDWTKHTDLKQTSVIYDGREILISHSEQTIFDGQNKLSCDDMVRLTRHYYNFFTKNFTPFGDIVDTIKIHKTLFYVRDTYEKLFY